MPTARKITRKFKRKKSFSLPRNASNGYIQNDVIIYSVCESCKRKVESTHVLISLKSAYELHREQLFYQELRNEIKPVSEGLVSKSQLYLSGNKWKLSFDQLGRLNRQVLHGIKMKNVESWIENQSTV